MIASEKCLRCPVRSTAICGGIKQKDIARLSKVVHDMKVAPGDCFLEQDEPADNYFIITSGTVTLFKLLPDGRRQVTGFADPGHFLGFANGGTYGFSAEAADCVSLCRISRRDINVLLADFRDMERRVLDLLSDELTRAQEQLLLLGRKTALERLASFLSTRTEQADAWPGYRTESARDGIVLPMNNDTIADYLGLTNETVSRMMGVLRDARIISRGGRNRVLVRDRDALDRIALGETPV